MQIATDRLRLRPYEAAHLDRLHTLWTSPGVRRYLFDDRAVERHQVEQEIRASEASFAAHGFGQWSVFAREVPIELIGFCGFRHFHEPPELELLYGLAEARWGAGLATEAAAAVMRYGFEECGFERIAASADAPNLASIRVMEKLGMTFDRRAACQGLDTVYYSVGRSAFRPRAGLYRLGRS